MDAIRRTLRDIHEGHITLIAAVTRFDTATGERLPAPIVEVTADREPAYKRDWPNPWWALLVDQGWLQLAPYGNGYQRYVLSEAGLAEMARRATT